MTQVNVKLQLEKSLVFHIIKKRGFKNLDDYLLKKLQDDLMKLKWFTWTQYKIGYM